MCPNQAFILLYRFQYQYWDISVEAEMEVTSSDEKTDTATVEQSAQTIPTQNQQTKCTKSLVAN